MKAQIKAKKPTRSTIISTTIMHDFKHMSTNDIRRQQRVTLNHLSEIDEDINELTRRLTLARVNRADKEAEAEGLQVIISQRG